MIKATNWLRLEPGGGGLVKVGVVRFLYEPLNTGTNKRGKKPQKKAIFLH